MSVFFSCAQKEWKEPGTGAWLGEAEKGCVTDKNKPGTHSKNMMTAQFDLKCKKIERIEPLTKLLDYFLWSNKSNINQTHCILDMLVNTPGASDLMPLPSRYR